VVGGTNPGEDVAQGGIVRQYTPTKDQLHSRGSRVPRVRLRNHLFQVFGGHVSSEVGDWEVFSLVLGLDVDGER